MKKLFVLVIGVIALSATLRAQNLILNPGCDDSLVGGKIPGWNEITGNNWTQRSESPAPYAGTSYFFAGAVSLGELGQIIDVSSDSAEIDQGTKYYYFTGFVRAYSQSPPDESNIFIHFSTGADILLSSCSLGPYTQTVTWLRVDTMLSAPPGARKIDIRLHSVRHNGSNNDGYYDELYLGNTPLVGIRETEQVTKAVIYPNPSTGLITVSFTGNIIQGYISILNLNGQQLIWYPVTKPETVIDISSLNSGVYFVRVTGMKTTATGKIVKH